MKCKSFWISLISLFVTQAGYSQVSTISMIPAQDSWINGTLDYTWGVGDGYQQSLGISSSGSSNVSAAYLCYNPGSIRFDSVSSASLLGLITYGTNQTGYNLNGLGDGSWSWDTLTAANAPGWSTTTCAPTAATTLLSTSGTESSTGVLNFQDSDIGPFVASTGTGPMTFIITKGPGSTYMASTRNGYSLAKVLPVLTVTGSFSYPTLSATITSTLNGMSLTGTAMRPDNGFLARATAAIARELASPSPALPAVVSGTNAVQVMLAYIPYAFAELATGTSASDPLVLDANSKIITSCTNYITTTGTLVDTYQFNNYGNKLHRIYEFYNPTTGNGFLSADAVAAIKKLFWLYTYDSSTSGYCTLSYINDWDPWHLFYGTENINFLHESTCWSAAKMLASDTNAPNYSNSQYADGSTPTTQYPAWNARFAKRLTERLRKGTMLEYNSTGYERYSLQGIYNLIDFGNSQLVNLATAFLDVRYAEWAQEQQNGITGGAGLRTYRGSNSTQWNYSSPAIAAGYFYTGVVPAGNYWDSTNLCMMTSAYRLPVIVDQMVATPRASGTAYEVTTRLPGLNRRIPSGEATPNSSGLGFCVDGEAPAILRYSYVTPGFTAGTLRIIPHLANDWATISCQNPFNSVVFSGTDLNARIVICPNGSTGDNNNFNPMWSVHKNGTIIAQQLTPPVCAYTGTMQVYVAPSLYLTRTTSAGTSGTWTFMQCNGSSGTAVAFAAIQSLSGWSSLPPASPTMTNSYMVCASAITPVIVQVAQVSGTITSMAAFQSAVLGQSLVTGTGSSAGIVTLNTYDGNTLALDTTYATLPTINGSQVDLQPPNGRSGPYVNSAWNGKQVSINFSSGGNNYVHTIDLN